MFAIRWRSLKEKALITAEQDVILMQAHGDILDNILELQDEISILINNLAKEVI